MQKGQVDSSLQVNKANGKTCSCLLHLSQKLQFVRCLSLSLLTIYIFILSSRTTGSFATKYGTKHPLVKVIQICQNKVQILLSSWGKSVIVEYNDHFESAFKNFLLISHSHNFIQTYHRASSAKGNSTLFDYSTIPY